MNKLQSLILALTILTPLFIFSQQANEEMNFLSNTRQLIYEGNRSGEGYFSQDGNKLIFQSEREAENPFYQIYILDFESGDINRVSPGTGKTTCAYFQWGGDRVIYSSSHLDKDAVKKQKAELDFRASGKQRRYSWDYEPEMDIFSSKTDGSDIKQLTSSLGYDAEGSVSPDGQWIVYSSNSKAFNGKLPASDTARFRLDPSYFCDLYIMKMDGSEVRQLTDVPGYDGGPFFSQDGKKIIWRRFTTESDKSDVYTMNVDGTGEKRITGFDCVSWAPFFHPSGKYIIFASNKMGFSNFELYLVDSEGMREPVRVTYTEGFDGLPVFSPDGRKLVWTASRTTDKTAQLFMAGWNHEYALSAIEKAPYRKQAENVTFSSEITVPDLRAKLSYLASDELGGRFTGSTEEKLAAQYISEKFTVLGLKPLPGKKDFFDEFNIVSNYEMPEASNSLSVKLPEGDVKALIQDEFIPLPGSENGSATGEIVFAGYGIKVEGKFDSYAGVDVKDKIVMVLRGSPEKADSNLAGILAENSRTVQKAMVARALGAKGLIIISKEIDKEIFNEYNPMNYGMKVAMINEKYADKIFKPAGFDLAKAINDFDKGIPAENKPVNTGLTASFNLDLVKTYAKALNVTAMLPANPPSDEYIVIGGHYDHLGKGVLNSRAPRDHINDVHNGADDNASGTATVMELAEYFTGLSSSSPQLINKNLVFALWTGEELGLLGSAHFLDAKILDLRKIKSYFNFDMVGRLESNKLYVDGLGSAKEWKSIVEKKNISAGFDLSLSDDPFLPTDAASFYMNNIPVASFFTGIHTDYHTPSDDEHLIKYEDMVRITKFAAEIIKQVMKPEGSLTFVRTEVTRPKMSTKGGKRVTLGTIPSYGSDVTGVKISGCRPEGPAEKAGLKANDIIVKLGEKEIKNIYEFMAMLDELKADVETDIVVIRDGNRMEMKIRPEAK